MGQNKSSEDTTISLKRSCFKLYKIFVLDEIHQFDQFDV